MDKRKNIWYYIKNYKFNSLFFRSFMLILLLLLIPFLTLSFLYSYNLTKITNDQIALENSSLAEGVKNALDTVIQECETLSVHIASNENVRMFMLNDWFNDTQSGSFGDFTQFINALPMIYRYVDSVYIFSELNGEVFAGERKTMLQDLRDDNWVEAYMSDNSRTGSIIPRVKNNNFPQLISIIKPVYIENEKMGAVVLNINSPSLYKTMITDRYKKGQEIYLVDENGRILLCKDSSLFGTRISDSALISGLSAGESAIRPLDSAEHMVSSIPSDAFGFSYISVLPMSAYQDKIKTMQSQIVFMLVGLILLSIIVAYIIAARSYDPVREIITFLDETDPREDSLSKNKDELNYIMHSIERHIGDKEQMQSILEDRMQMLKKSQYAMLQAQINPHFLYNTLETINWMAYSLTNDENDVSRAVISLANLFRNNTSDEAAYLIPISQELKHTQDYLNILNLRYGDLFDVVWEVDEGIYGCAIINICLQPIIENAVYHGLKPKDEKGLLKIKGQAYGSRIVFAIEDDGVGMDGKTIEELNRRLLDDNAQNSSHIGLLNVNQRIRIIFGNAYGVFVRSRQNGGTVVLIELPKTTWRQPED